MTIFSSCLIWPIFSFILPQDEYGCVYVVYTDLRSTYRRWRFWKIKIIFSNEAHFDLGGYVNKQNCSTSGTENPHAHAPTHPKRVTVWCGLWSRGVIGPFFFENETPLQSMAIVIGECWTNFCSQKLNRWILTTFGFNRMALQATQPKLHSMFCALFRSCYLTPLDYYL